MPRKTLFLLLGLGFALVANDAGAAGLPIRFTLDWKIQGVHAWFYWAKERGLFRNAGLDVTIDQGDGSAATVTRIMSGAYDAGFGDVNAVVQATGVPGAAPPVVTYMIYGRAPLALFAPAGGPVRTVADLAGRRLGAPAGAAALKLFPVLARANRLDPAQVTIVNMTPNLVEAMLVRGQVDVSAGFTVTSYINLFALGKDPDAEFRWLPYADHGLDLYSNAVMVSRELAMRHPAAVTALVAAINQALHAVAAAPAAGIDVIAAVEPLTDRALERRRLDYALSTLIVTPESRRLGIGDIDDARMTAAIATVAEAYDLPRRPTVAEIFDRRHLPPRAERLPASRE